MEMQNMIRRHARSWMARLRNRQWYAMLRRSGRKLNANLYLKVMSTASRDGVRRLPK